MVVWALILRIAELVPLAELHGPDEAGAETA
jgi:hypothetical protein